MSASHVSAHGDRHARACVRGRLINYLYCIHVRFDGADFLTRMKGKTVMFVGDSLGRNQWESLVCLLHAAVPQSPAQLVSADPLYTYKFLVCYVYITCMYIPHAACVIIQSLAGRRD